MKTPNQIMAIKTDFEACPEINVLRDHVYIFFNINSSGVPEYIVVDDNYGVTYLPASSVVDVLYADCTTAESGSALVECILLVAIMAVVLAFPFIIGGAI